MSRLHTCEYFLVHFIWVCLYIFFRYFPRQFGFLVVSGIQFILVSLSSLWVRLERGDLFNLDMAIHNIARSVMILVKKYLYGNGRVDVGFIFIYSCKLLGYNLR